MSKRAIKIAEKVLASDGVLPARLQVKDGDFWTLQWSELRCLGTALKRMLAEPRLPEKPSEEAKMAIRHLMANRVSYYASDDLAEAIYRALYSQMTEPKRPKELP